MPASTRFIQQCLKQRIPTYGTWITFADSEIARIVARSGFQWCAIDCEHAAIDARDIRDIAATVSDSSIVPLCRIPCGRHDYIKRALDAGCLGIIAPMVETVEDAQHIINACYYPPLGNRSFGPGSHYLNLVESNNDMETYFRQANDQIIVILQTESPKGIQNAPDIYKLPGIHGILIGPRDLRGQLIYTAKDSSHVTNAEFDEALQTIQRIAKDSAVPLGIHVATDKDCIQRIDQGYSFFTVGSDRSFLLQEAVRTSETIRSHIASYEKSSSTGDGNPKDSVQTNTETLAGSVRNLY